MGLMNGEIIEARVNTLSKDKNPYSNVSYVL